MSCTAWLTTQADLTLDGTRCEVSVTEDEPSGAPEPVPPVILPVLASDGDDERAKAAAEDALTRAGWTVSGGWEQYDHGYNAPVRRID